MIISLGVSGYARVLIITSGEGAAGMANTTSQPAIQSVSRAAAILRCFSDSQELGLVEISRLVGLHKSTTAGIVNTLTSERFLDKNAHNGKYRLGLDLYCLAVSSKIELSKICEPHLNKLLEITGETVNVAVRDGSNVVYIAKKESLYSMRISTSVGKRMPLYCTAMGKAILAFLPETEVKDCLAEVTFTRFTERTVNDIDKLTAQFPLIREQGVAFDMEELEPGLICVAVPVLDKMRMPVCAVSVSGPSLRMGECERLEIAACLLRISHVISEEVQAAGI